MQKNGWEAYNIKIVFAKAKIPITPFFHTTIHRIAIAAGDIFQRGCVQFHISQFRYIRPGFFFCDFVTARLGQGNQLIITVCSNLPKEPYDPLCIFPGKFLPFPCQPVFPAGIRCLSVKIPFR